jgi:hypothetical protein
MISVEAKVKLYKALLKLFGVGAKTNVGYGILKDYDPNRVSQPTARETSERDTNRNQAAYSGSCPAPQRTNTSPNRQSERPTRSGDEITMKICPDCGKKNYKYKPNPDRTLSTQIHDDWMKKKCHGCGRRLDLE